MTGEYSDRWVRAFRCADVVRANNMCPTQYLVPSRLLGGLGGPQTRTTMRPAEVQEHQCIHSMLLSASAATAKGCGPAHSGTADAKIMNKVGLYFSLYWRYYIPLHTLPHRFCAVQWTPVSFLFKLDQV